MVQALHRTTIDCLAAEPPNRRTAEPPDRRTAIWMMTAGVARKRFRESRDTLQCTIFAPRDGRAAACGYSRPNPAGPPPMSPPLSRRVGESAVRPRPRRARRLRSC
ncbi:hypothetical protein AQ876_27450 [Burkholderia pseudomallei]|nr:hypothetical protein AQ876_27450 [Burkholderia pseudomallei]